MVTRLRAERQRRGYNLNQCAALLGTDAGNLSRIEVGKQRPGPEMAHKLFDFYEGEVPLGAIYDPVFARERGVDGMVNNNELDAT